MLVQTISDQPFGINSSSRACVSRAPPAAVTTAARYFASAISSVDLVRRMVEVGDEE